MRVYTCNLENIRKVFSSGVCLSEQNIRYLRTAIFECMNLK